MWCFCHNEEFLTNDAWWTHIKEQNFPDFLSEEEQLKLNGPPRPKETYYDGRVAPPSPPVEYRQIGKYNVRVKE